MIPVRYSKIKESLSELKSASRVHWSARTVLMVQVLGVFLLIFPVFGYSVWLEWHSLLVTQVEEMVLRANSLAARQTTLVASTRSLLISMSLSPSIRSGDSESIYHYFQQVGAIQQDYDGFAFFNTQGETVASIYQGTSRILPPESIRERLYFKEAQKNDVFNVSLPLLMDSGIVFPMTLPVSNAKGERVGLIMAALSLERQTDVVKNILNDSKFSVKFFDSSYNEALCATNNAHHQDAMDYVAAQDLFSFFKENSYKYTENGKITPRAFNFSVQNKRFVGSVVALQLRSNDPYLYIVVLADEISFFDFINQRYAWQIIIISAFVMFALWVSTLFGRKYFADGLERLAEVAIASRGGDLSVRTGHISGCDEIQVLSATVDSMMDELEAKTARLVELAKTDPLTEIWNRRHFMEVGERECQLARRHGHPLAVVMADIDFFKKVNDTYGHGAGDDVLKMFAQTLLKNLRTTDLLARYGGEEFIILLPDTDKNGASFLVERLRQAVENSVCETSEGYSIRITSSFGVAVYSSDSSDSLILSELQSKADAAMYESKANGRNRVTIA